MRSQRYVMVVDTRRCVGCNACALACKAENAVPDGAARSWVTVETRGVFPNLTQEILSQRCNHCDSPACVSACPTGASHIAEGGVVMVEHDACTGCKACMAACPYDARYIHPEGYADKCTFCLHRVKEGRPPACVEVCPTKALVFGDLNDPDSEVARLLRTRKHKVQKPQQGVSPNVYFLT